MNYILLPAYNEEGALAPLLQSFQNVTIPVIHIVVVDDGSTDKTADVVRSFAPQLPATLLQHTQNQGLGKTMATGLNYLLKIMTPLDTLTALDADNTHLPSQIPEMLQKIQDGHDIVIRSRYRKGAMQKGVPFRRQILSLAASFYLRAAAPVPGVRDYSCGFRTYSGTLLRNAWERYGEYLIEENSFACMTELLLKLSVLKPKIIELPLTLRYDLKPTPSKMNVSGTITRYFVILKKIQKKAR